MLVKRKRRKGPGQEGLITASPFLMPSLIGLLVFSLLPLLISAFISLTDWNGLDQLTAPGFFQEHFIGLIIKPFSPAPSSGGCCGTPSAISSCTFR